MVKHNQSGTINGVLVSLILAVLLLIGALAFGAWAFNSRQDYKNHVDSKVSAAVTVAKQNQSTTDQSKFDEEAKQPLKTYVSPEAYGSLTVNFPKTWSAYVDDTGTGSALVDGYFAPGVVPSATSTNSVFALRVQVIPQPYSQILKTFTAQEQDGQLKASAYALPKVPSSVGVEIVGQVEPQTPTETIVVLPLRSNTLEIWTQGSQYLDDFNNNILPNFTFSP